MLRSTACHLLTASLFLIACSMAPGEGRKPDPLRDYFNAQCDAAYAARSARLESLKTTDDITAYQAEKRAYLLKALGGLPERTPLNARVTGQTEADGYRYEKVIFESQPGFFVTGILYLPLASAPVPGVIVPCGHSQDGKAYEAYQRASILLAKNGIAAFCYDPAGQGERVLYTGRDGVVAPGATVEHTLYSVSAILTGTNFATFSLWDGMRALDYLQTRPEIDPKHLGCTGNSGGGTQTAYLMALDERIDCAAPSCYITSFNRLLNTIGPQDGEQNIFGEIANGIDHADFLNLRAPKPTLICAATHDFFDIGGTWDSFREAKRVYTKLSFSERVDLIENDDKHGFNTPQREAMVRWMRRWLLGIDAPVTESDFPVHTEAELQCTPTGNVHELPGARSVFQLLQEREAGLKEQREHLAATLSPAELRQRIAEKIAYTPGDAAPKIEARDDAGRTLLSITPAPGAPAIEATLTKPQGALLGIVVCLRPEGRAAADAEKIASSGLARIYVDLTGTALAEPDESGGIWDNTVGPGWPAYFRAYQLGQSFVGLWVRDIVATARAARAALNSPDARVSLDARGFTCIPAAHAAALEPGLLHVDAMQGGISSWHEVIANVLVEQQLLSTVHGALELYDLDQLPALWQK